LAAIALSAQARSPACQAMISSARVCAQAPLLARDECPLYVLLHTIVKTRLSYLIKRDHLRFADEWRLRDSVAWPRRFLPVRTKCARCTRFSRKFSAHARGRSGERSVRTAEADDQHRRPLNHGRKTDAHEGTRFGRRRGHGTRVICCRAGSVSRGYNIRPVAHLPDRTILRLGHSDR